MTGSRKTKNPVAAEPKTVDLATLQESPEGKELIEIALKFREQCLKLNLPVTVIINGIAPFAAEFQEQVRAQGFIDGRQYERINGQYSKVIGAKSNEIH